MKSNKPANKSIALGDTSIPIKKKNLKNKNKFNKKDLLKRISYLESVMVGHPNTDLIISSIESQLNVIMQRLDSIELLANTASKTDEQLKTINDVFLKKFS